MDFGDFIFIFVFILVILGRVLSWIFKQFVVNQSVENADQTSSKPQSIKDYVIDWLRSLENQIESNQWDKQTSGNEWEAPEHEYYEKLESPELIPVKQSPPEKQINNDIRTQRIAAKTRQKKNAHNKFQIDLKKAIIHYEILSRPVSLRQENPYDRKCFPK
jgi:hypothetical protein